ncbi:MAG: tetratricopeptide repeat protein, partial [Pleurocapsa sp. MO_226.B13]|nr:tetratricopeptide repeat protein [Pleurocapsa sp. MO_226.B13]
NQEAWWWFWEKEVPQPNSDWVGRVISISCWTISLSLFGDITPRFLTGRPDWFGTLAVSIQSVFALLTGGSLLTQEGRKALTNIIHRIFHRRSWDRAGVFSSFALMLLLIGFRTSLPQFARLYNHWGWQNYEQGKLLSAESDLQRAIALNPEYSEAHSNLGLIYEDLQDFKQARKQYEIAFKQKYLPAWNNIAHLYILEEKYSEAEQLLLRLEHGYEEMDNQTKSAFWKNLGWVKWEQKNYQEAKDYLEQAIALKADSEQWAAPHCLLAQVLEQLNERTTALDQWEICLREHSIYDPNELEWGAIAAERLAPQKSQP